MAVKRALRLLLVAVSSVATMAWTTEVAPTRAASPKPKAPLAGGAPDSVVASQPPTATTGPTAPLTVTHTPATSSEPATAANGSSPRSVKPVAGAVALAAALEGDAASTTLVLTLTRTARFVTFALADPYRVVIDLQDVEFRIPPATGTLGRGLVKSFRYGLLAPGKSRIVIDITGPVAIEKNAMIASRGADTVQLRVALSPVDRATFLATAATVAAPVQAAAVGQGAGSSMPGTPVSGAVAGTNGGARRSKSGKPVIVLDPGHGGIDAGTLGSGPSVAEKDVVLRFAKLLREKIQATGRFEVRLTRDIDVFVRLDERVRLAREWGCDLFISLHTDSVPAQIAHLNVRGATLYTMSEQGSDARAQQLAEKENLSDVIAGVEGRVDEQPEVATILTDLMRRETSNSARTFTTTLLGHMKKTTGLSREPHRHAAFKVLRAPDFPSVLIELGFLSNKEDEKLLVAKAWQEQVAGSVLQAVDAYFSRKVARTPF